MTKFEPDDLAELRNRFLEPIVGSVVMVDELVRLEVDIRNWSNPVERDALVEPRMEHSEGKAWEEGASSVWVDLVAGRDREPLAWLFCRVDELRDTEALQLAGYRFAVRLEDWVAGSRFAWGQERRIVPLLRTFGTDERNTFGHARTSLSQPGDSMVHIFRPSMVNRATVRFGAVWVRYIFASLPAITLEIPLRLIWGAFSPLDLRASSLVTEVPLALLIAAFQGVMVATLGKRIFRRKR